MKALFAMSINRAIGLNGGLPWPRIPKDMAFFREKTLNKKILMGRKTYDGLGVNAAKLTNRHIFVLTSRLFQAGADCSIGQIVSCVSADQVKDQNIDWICGGREVYNLFLPKCDELYVTHVKREWSGDTFMPQFEHLFTGVEEIYEDSDIRITRWQNDRLHTGEQI